MNAEEAREVGLGGCRGCLVGLCLLAGVVLGIWLLAKFLY